MRVLIVHNTLNDSRSVSGVLRHYGWMANEWRAAGHEVDFLAASCASTQIRDLAPQARLISSDKLFDATKYLAQTWRYFPAYGLRLLTAHLLRLPCRYDVIYASTQLIVEVYAAMILARRQQAKFVAKVHHVLAAQPKRLGLFDRLFLWSERRTTRWLNQRADLILCGTPLVANDYSALERSLGLVPRPVTSIGYGIDLSAIPFDENCRKNFDAVMLGRLHEHKGVFDLPHIWRLVVQQRPGAKVLIIGEGPHRQRMQDMFAELGMRDLAVFTGGISEARKNEILGQARIGLSLSSEEGWGLSINEFLGNGLPVIAYELPIFGHVFPHQLELVPLGDRAGAARKILSLLADEPFQRKRGKAGREFVARYDYRKVAKAELAAVKALFDKS